MKEIAEEKNTRKILKERGVSAKKRLGQNFLIDKSVLKSIIGAAALSADDTVLEIGPGLGTLTGALCAAAGSVTAVEIDREMIPILRENLKDFDNLRIVESDILKTDLGELFPEGGAVREDAASMAVKAPDTRELPEKTALSAAGIKVVANLPYYITTPVIMYLLESPVPIRSITLMVQREVAGRLLAKPGGKDYGAITLAVRYRAAAELIREVPAEAFLPKPKVDSAVIRLDMYEVPPVTVADEREFFGIIKAAFAERRKTLANALANAPRLNVGRGDVREVLREMGLSADIRGERLSLGEFAELSGRLAQRGH